MKPDEKFAVLCEVRDARAYTVVAAARVAIAINDRQAQDNLKQALAAFDHANKTALSYANSKEYKTFLAGHQGTPLR